MRPSIGLIGRIVAILLLTLVIEFGVSTLMYERASQFAVREDEAHRLAEHLVISRRLVADAPAQTRGVMAAELTTDRYALHYDETRPPPPPLAPSLDVMRRQVVGWEPSLAASNLRMQVLSPGHRPYVTGGLTLPDGTWLYFRTREPVTNLNLSTERILLALVPALALMLLGGMLVRRTLLPLRRLAIAADAFDGGGGQAVPESGPVEVRRVTSAFNRMQARIQRLIADRTQALAAVGHDLRTPLARLKLRTDTIADRDVHDAVQHDVIEMEAMVASLLAFLGGDDDPEQPVRTDLAVLCATIVDAAVDAGHDATYAGPDHFDVTTRPMALRRAVNNLVDNAARHGERVFVTVSQAGAQATIAIEDDGPGIPEEALGRVLEPFVRLDDARRRDTVGFGLGLPIVVRMVDMLGGTLTLGNRPAGGLCARIVLPA